MIPEKWEEIKEMVNGNFEVIESGREIIADIPGATLEFMEFFGPMGRMRIEFISKPKILDKKTLYSNRVGGDVKVDYVYSEQELVYQFMAYQWDEVADDWKEIEFNL
ncbi:MAG: hypothetical protein ACOZBH_04265 [Patescibacteria group bacterium]